MENTHNTQLVNTENTPSAEPASTGVTNKLNGKTVNLDLVGLDGSAFYLFGAFRRQARQEGWTSEEITIVCDDAMSGDYDHLLAVLMVYCSPQ